MRKIIILILLIWPNFSVADQGLEILCLNMKSAFGSVAQETLGRRAVHSSFWLGSSGDTISLLAQMLDLL